jgi:hypothetical protein
MTTGHQTSRVHQFEAAALLRCTNITASRYATARRPADRTPGLLAEFSQEWPADRLAELLADTVPTDRADLVAGGRRLHRLYRVTVPAGQVESTYRLLESAWSAGRRELLTGATLGSSSPRQALRWALAVAAWRAALLAAGRRRRPDYLGIRVGDPETAAVLVRSARVLDVPVSARSGGGCTLLAVAAQDRLSERLAGVSARTVSTPRRAHLALAV